MAARAKVTTVADMIAAVKLGTIDPKTEVVTAVQAERTARKAATDAATLIAAQVQEAAASPTLSTTVHDCGIAGCRHGDAHPAVSQPDRQVKLQCPSCGAVARMTARALARAQGRSPICGGDGATFAPAARRTYSKRAA